jgi:hypothetical protein
MSSSGAPQNILKAGGRVANGTDIDVGQYSFIVSISTTFTCIFAFKRSYFIITVYNLQGARS